MVNLKLVRIVSAYFEPGFTDWRSWTMQMGDINVKTIGYREVDGKLNLFIAAEVKLPFMPELTSDNKIIPNEVFVRKTQEALETVVNLLAVSKGSKRQISSAVPYVAFLPEDDAAKQWLDSTNGIDIWAQALPSCNVRIYLANKSILDGLIDRLDGVELMAEALSHAHVTGRFHELMRLFERGFKVNRN